VIVAFAAACGGNGRGPEPEPVSAGAARFTADAVPAGYDLAIAGDGGLSPEWGEDSSGTHEPFVALRDEDGIVVVSVTGFEGYQGGLEQAALGYTDDLEPTDVDGDRAVFTPADGSRPADLVVERGDDLAVRARGAGRTEEELAALVRATEPSRSRNRPPSVDPRDGFEELGDVTADVVLAMEASLSPFESDLVPGPSTASVIGWRAGNRHLVAEVLPADEDAVAAIAEGVLLGRPYGLESAMSTEVDGRPATALRGEAVVVVTTTSWGDLLVVKSSNLPLLDVDDLVTVASSVRRIDEKSWDALIVEASGGPGLHSDRDGVELSRGEEGDVEWLLQAKPGNATPQEAFDGGPAGGWWIDPCLKLAVGPRACASQGGGGNHTGSYYLSATDPVPGLPGFVVVVTAIEAASVGTGGTIAPLHRLPGDVPRWGGVLFTGQPRFPRCDVPGEGLDLLDIGGTVVGCVG
jgi:hypothetical protein